MAFFHTQNAVKAKLFFAPLHNKAVHIKQNHQGKDTADPGAHLQHSAHGNAACGGAVRHHKRHGTQTVKQHDNQRRGHKIRQIDVLIVFDIGQRHADIEVSTHSLSLPSPGL